MHERKAIVAENRKGPFGQSVKVGGHELRADEPEEIGGLGEGLDPYEFLIAGLGACTSMTVRMYAKRKGWALDHIEVTVRHVERMTDGAAQDVFARELRLDGDLSEEERQRLYEIAGRCPVARTLAKGVTITSTLADNAVGEATS